MMFYSYIVLEIGGFPTESLSSGLNPEGLNEYLAQRARWCIGGVQIGKWLWRNTKSIRAKFSAVLYALSWGYSALMTLLWYIVTLTYMLTGFLLIPAQTIEVLAYFLPFSIIRLGFAWTNRHTRLPFVTDILEVIAAPTVIISTVMTMFGKKVPNFVVTQKSITNKNITIHWRIVIFYSVLFITLLVLLIYRTVNCFATSCAQYIVFIYYLTVSQLIVLLSIIVAAIERPRLRASERYLVNA
ncbi:MAG: hypothetical protein JW841_09585 [Deltaproteobacteria bacterium]|nr:hypothetical protein [Deltaproteobacteria bacterium]